MKWNYYNTVWLVLFLGWVSNYMIRIAIAPALTFIRKEFNLSFAEAGLLATAYFITYTAIQVPAGYLGDTLGRRLVLAAGAITSAATSSVMAVTTSFTQLLGLRFLTGLAAGSYFSNDRPMIAAHTPSEKMALGQGVSFMGVGVGILVGISVGGIIADHLGWRWVFLLFSLPSAMVGGLMVKLLREPPRNRHNIQRRASYQAVLLSRDLWLLYIGGVPLIYTLYFVGTWAPAALVEIAAIDLSTSSLYASLLGAGSITGLPIMGHISDRLSRKLGLKVVIAVESLGLAAVLGVFGYALAAGRVALAFMAPLIFAIGFLIYGSEAPILALTSRLAPLEVMGTAFGLLNGINFIGSLFSPWVTGVIRDITGSFAWGSYLSAIFVLIGSLLILGVRPAYRLGVEGRAGSQI